MPDGKKVPGRPLANLEDERHREFVSHYTNPTSEGFGRQTVAAELAGFHKSYGTHLMKLPHIQLAINEVIEGRMEEGTAVATYFRTFSRSAVEKLRDQLFFGDELELIDARAELEKYLDGKDGEPGKVISKEAAGLLRELNKHNGNVIDAQKVSKNAAELWLAYELGTPQQNIVHRNERRRETAASGVDDEELKAMLKAVQTLVEDAREAGQLPSGEIVEADYEIEEE